MKLEKLILTILIGLSFSFQELNAKIPDNIGEAPVAEKVSWRADCVRPVRQIEMQVNNVRARLLTGGDIWSEAQYIVPKPAPGQLPVSALYAGGVWIGGVDRAKNIKLSAVTYRAVGFDFFSGPLDANGATEAEVCRSWDRFFTVTGINVRNHFNKVLRSIETGVEINCDSIPDDVKFWPGQGNPYWRSKFTFALPDQPLGSFWDQDENGIYDPCGGDFPIIDIRGCEPRNIFEARELIPDEMIFWIYNDNGGPQTLSGNASIRMEVQVQSFAYSTNDEINDMTFYRYKLINKASEDLLDCYFSMWIDPDLGCYSDDYIGCDIGRSLAYVYNEDAIDGNSGANCGGTNTYGTDIPLLGMDYFRGPLGPKVFKRDNDGNVVYGPVLDENGDTVRVNGEIQYSVVLLDPEPFTGNQDTLVELGMTSFTYAENGGIGAPPPQTTDPQRGREDGFYNYIRGLWNDGTPVTFGGSGFNPGSTDTIRYVFPDDPNNINGWSMCTATLPNGDRRTMQATGPLLLQPGAENELIMGVVFVPTVVHPCPDLTRLRFADDIAQALFDNCFNITDGPDAPDITAVELDQELIIMLSNELTSNNFNESYAETDLQAPILPGDQGKYIFEGYRLYQLASANVTAQELGDISKARQVAQVDIRNGVKEIYNWTGEQHPLLPFGPIIWTPTKMVTGGDKGLQTTFRVTEDQFALTNRRLVNHRQYHFLVLAYAYNNWQILDIETGVGQKRAYLEGRGNVGGPDKKAYTLVPRPIVYEDLQSAYGEGPSVTRIAGEGNPGKFLDMDESMYELILKKTHDGKILYKSGAGPIDAKVVDPLKIKDGKFRLEITGNFGTSANGNNCSFDNTTVWKLSDVTQPNNPKVLLDKRPLSYIKEYIIQNMGFSITVSNEEDPGATRVGANGGIGATVTYKDDAGPRWFNAVRDGGNYGDGIPSIRYYDHVRTGFNQDPLSALSRIGNGFFVPFITTRYQNDEDLPFFLSTSAREVMGYLLANATQSLRLRDLNNVDIVFTSDKSKWSKCIVVETATADYYDGGTIGNTKNFELRESPSKDENGNEIPNSKGFSYFPGYAIDVETGKRLNIFFGENSYFSGANAEVLDGKNPIGGDMIFNPSSQAVVEELTIRNPNTGEVADFSDLRGTVAGGQHYIYVTRMEYDGCAEFADRLKRSNAGAGPSIINKAKVGASVTWTSFAMGMTSAPMLPIDKGLIPNDMTVKLRVNNPYGESRKYTTARERACDTDGDQPIYEFEFKGKQSQQLATQEEYVGALANVNVVPNPYYAYSAYETSQFTNTIKITNLPAKAVVTIYSIDGSFIRQYNRDEREVMLAGSNRPTSTSQVYPDLEWDMKNFKEIPVASGVYLIHIVAPEYGEERTIKWFGIGRKFDPSGL